MVPGEVRLYILLPPIGYGFAWGAGIREDCKFRTITWKVFGVWRKRGARGRGLITRKWMDTAGGQKKAWETSLFPRVSEHALSRALMRRGGVRLLWCGRLDGWAWTSFYSRAVWTRGEVLDLVSPGRSGPDGTFTAGSSPSSGQVHGYMKSAGSRRDGSTKRCGARYGAGVRFGLWKGER